MIRFMSVKICTTSRRSPCLFSLFTYISLLNHFRSSMRNKHTRNSGNLVCVPSQRCNLGCCRCLCRPCICKITHTKEGDGDEKLLFIGFGTEERELTVDHKCVHQDCQNQDQSKASKLSALSLPNNL